MQYKLHRLSDTIQVHESEVLGAGGQAKVFVVMGHPEWVAKVYTKPNLMQSAKLAVMVANPPADPMAAKGHTSIAWPLDLLVGNHEQIAGFIMPRVQRTRPLSDYFNPKTRRQQCPGFSYSYLLRTARNMAAAFHAIHSRGYVVGDVNDSNILVSQTALVTLVDTDSFQVYDSGSGAVYRCPVGRAEYSAPEVLAQVSGGRSYADSERQAQQDLFGLGILLFQLLMEGSHPFGGAYTGGGDPPPYADRIAAGHFGYDANHAGPYRPSPLAPPFEMLHPSLQQQFRECFVGGHTKPGQRPTALTWQRVLDQVEQEFVICRTNSQHRFWSHWKACPWCERTERLGGRDPFPPLPGAALPGLPPVTADTGLTSQKSLIMTAADQNVTPAENDVRPARRNARQAVLIWPNIPLAWFALGVAILTLPLTVVWPQSVFWLALAGLGCGVKAWSKASQPTDLERWPAIYAVLLGAVVAIMYISPPSRQESHPKSLPVSSLIPPPEPVQEPQKTALETRANPPTARDYWSKLPSIISPGSPARRGIGFLAFSPDGQTLGLSTALTSLNRGAMSVQLWDYRSISLLCEFPASVTSSSSRQIRSGSTPPSRTTEGDAESVREQLMRRYGLQSPNRSSTVPGNQRRGRSLPATYSRTPSVMAWSFTRDNQVLAVGHQPDSAAVRSSPGQLSLWNVRTGKFVRQFNLPISGVSTAVASASLSDLPSLHCALAANGRYLVTVWSQADNRSDLILWNVETGAKLGALSDEELPTMTSSAPGRLPGAISKQRFDRRSFIFSPEGQALACSYRDQNQGAQVILWKIPEMKAWRSLSEKRLPDSSSNRARGGISNAYGIDGESPVLLMAFSPDSRLLAVYDDYSGNLGIASGSRNISWCRIWDLTSGNALRPVTSQSTSALRISNGGIVALAFSPDRQTLACINGKGEVELQNIYSGSLVQILTPSNATSSQVDRGARCVAYSPDGKTLAVGNQDGTIDLWRLKAY